MRSKGFFHRLIVLLLFSVAAPAATADGELIGSYDVTGKTVDGRAYGGQIDIAPHGKGVKLDWALGGGDRYSGRALQLDGVLGGVYWEQSERYNDPGVVVYRIDGGKLQGIWMPGGAPLNSVGREDLVGPASLEGRFEIILGEQPGGRSHYSGHVNVTRRGDTYLFRWYAPNASYVGGGIRLGNVMVVGYALGRAPGTVAYCIQGKDLEGAWAYGEQTRLGREALRRQAGAGDTPAGADTQEECLGTVALRGPAEVPGPGVLARASNYP